MPGRFFAPVQNSFPISAVEKRDDLETLCRILHDS